MICAFSPYGEKCQCCCKYFGAYWTFWLQLAQLVHLLLIFIFIIATNTYLKESGDLKKAANMTIVAFVFNVLHNIVTILMSRYRDDVSNDLLNAKSVLCCYTWCPNCAGWWDIILGVFNCFCIIDCFGFYIYEYYMLIILGVAQFILGTITTAVALNATKLVSNAKKKDFADGISMIVFAFAVLLLIFTILNFLCNLICIIRFVCDKCKGMTFHKREASEKEDQQSEKDEKADQIENEQKPTEPNQNQENEPNPVDIVNQNESDDNKKDDPEIPEDKI